MEFRCEEPRTATARTAAFILKGILVGIGFGKVGWNPRSRTSDVFDDVRIIFQDDYHLSYGKGNIVRKLSYMREPSKFWKTYEVLHPTLVQRKPLKTGQNATTNIIG